MANGRATQPSPLCFLAPLPLHVFFCDIGHVGGHDSLCSLPIIPSSLFLGPLEGASGDHYCVFPLVTTQKFLSTFPMLKIVQQGQWKHPEGFLQAALSLLTSFSVKLPVSTTAPILSPCGNSFRFRCFMWIFAS